MNKLVILSDGSSKVVEMTPEEVQECHRVQHISEIQRAQRLLDKGHPPGKISELTKIPPEDIAKMRQR